ncbi:TPA: glycosyltransferase family 2 protein [Streptococcus suis]|uniref:glycosyltransferase family 2 protein n=1 Tax=Streptococcus parasuis TaxID=1501662 RepID=UPI00040DC2BA|nr:glycosyltransferase family 2 protein [Streptococcus parasuis]NQM55852.1 glycosyltransferase family 2 protein [Streptococcus suis]MDG4477835.1 glycosyltransferase family 2 protein [Streptococcus parasuis]NQN52530.1 glycosyltransferase family 2 protein [Streptococcus suis]NQN91978.1 glycosyltransferase family 2 protein [Streptococcus suis]NQP59594.1 glycosyltransferase family 2 protein [Streptococcus suis]
MKKLSVVVPCYNEEKTIVPFLESIARTEKELSDKLQFSYIFIDDGSSDNTLKVLKEASSQNSNIHFISFSRNFGKEAALLAGLEEADGDFVTVMDVDLQDPPELLVEMYSKINDGYDIVATRRSNRIGEPIIRSFFAKLFYRIMNRVSSTEMIDGARDFRLMTRQVVDSILELKEVNRFSKGLFSWVGYKVTYISYENRERVAGETSWSFWSLLKYSIEGFINFSDVPLTLATWAGLFSFFLSIVGAVFVIIRQIIFSDPVPGWASIVTIILFLGGIQLLALGIIGKYISKIFLETKKRPIYIVKERS